MKKVLAGAALVVLIFLSAYGTVRLLLDLASADGGRTVSDMAGDLASKTAKAAGDRLAEELAKTPDEKLEADAEQRARKLYPILKGAMKGNLEAFLEDKNKDEISQAMYQAGKEFSRTVIQPFAKGVADAPPPLVGEVQEAIKRLRGLRQGKGNVVESIVRGLESLAKELGPPRPAMPPNSNEGPGPYGPPPQYSPLPPPR